jgi:hypothetical protein
MNLSGYLLENEISIAEGDTFGVDDGRVGKFSYENDRFGVPILAIRGFDCS